MPDDYELACEANDAYRRSWMNVKYYGVRLARSQRMNLVMEIIIAIGTSGTIASLTVWQNHWGKLLFAFLVTVSAIAGTLKPILDPAGHIARYSKLWSSYNSLFNSLERITRDMRLHQQLRPEMHGAVESALDAYANLATTDDPSPDKDLLKLARNEAVRELPADRLWWPEGCTPTFLGSDDRVAEKGPVPAAADLAHK